VHGLFHIEAPEYEPEESARGTLDLVAVVDISGSMAGSKLNLCKETLRFLINNLSANDRLSVVTYNSHINVEFELTNMTSDAKVRCTDMVEKLKASECTNLSGGLFQGMQLLQGRPEGSRATVSSVLLMTDGMANEGVKGEALVKMTRSLLGENPGYTLYTFGYGSSHNEDLLKEISEVGSGMYYFIESNEIIPESFADCLGGLLSVVAQNIRLTITASIDGLVIEKVHSAFKQDLSEDHRKATITMGDIQSEEKRDILLSYTLPKLAEPSPDHTPVLSCELSYANAITSSFDTDRSSITVRRPAVVDDKNEPGRMRHAEVERQVARVQAADAMSRARGHARRGSFTSAQAEIRTTLATFEASPHMYVQALSSDLRTAMDEMSSQSQWQARGKYMVTNMEQKHMHQRCNRVWRDHESSSDEEEKAVSYRSKARKQFRVKATKSKQASAVQKKWSMANSHRTKSPKMSPPPQLHQQHMQQVMLHNNDSDSDSDGDDAIPNIALTNTNTNNTSTNFATNIANSISNGIKSAFWGNANDSDSNDSDSEDNDNDNDNDNDINDMVVLQAEEEE
jgi:uncharacterized protein YegL